ncbi:DNA translocase FtsK 4TM domain-containing protein [Peptoniphilus sp. KCTC 25270]|uniref:FtsK/SpoIIIE family DNA translocase n=1 Tax=Peptoniphilus sp. KCTC 25270 TaxID=2897414 RepID=UPI001E61FA3D|nr:DNA translocase FtsK [Peptoniphilus sp. KCTC 25270]MCD1146997.1 DNA translocase FtsK 4TM domain-containing protein [Peptoniphilus sp. KCTC 25270]
MTRKTGSKNKKNKSSNKFSEFEMRQRQQILGGFFLILAILFFVSLLSTEMGIFGEFIRKSFHILMGKSSYVFSILLAVIGSFYIFQTPSYTKKRIFLATGVLFLTSLVYFQANSQLSSLTWSNRVERASFPPVDGGILGEYIGEAFIQFLGTVGTSILLIALLIFSISLLITKETRQKIVQWTQRKYSELKEAKETKKSKEMDQSIQKTSSKRKPSKEREKIQEGNESLRSSSEIFYEENHLNKEPVIVDYRPTTPAKPVKETKLKQEEKTAFEQEIRLEEEAESYEYPSLELLNEYENTRVDDNELIKRNARLIEETMENFNIDCKVSSINRGPSITCYELLPAPGVRLNRIVALSDNLSLSLASPDIRIEAPIPGKSAVGIEVPNSEKDSVSLKEILSSDEFKKIDTKVPLSLGKDVSGKTIISSIDKMPHLLIAGATGSGKSVCINTILMSILYKSSPNDVKLILIDPKVVELGIYNNIPHLLIPVVTDAKKAAFALSWAVDEMEKRYKSFAAEGVRDINGYNHKVDTEEIKDRKMPRIVIVVDELSDLMMVAAKEVEDYITRLAQMARAAGIHLIIATQRPSVDVITGTIKANIPSRIAFAVSSQIDSRTILDMGGAEKLLGKGDMLFYPNSAPKPIRLQGAFVSDEEVEKVIDFIKNNSQESEYNNEAIEAVESKISADLTDRDELLDEAIRLVLTQEQASISFIQRKLKVGYARAARIVDQMEETGIIGPHEGSKPRKIVLSDEEINEYLNSEEE